MHNEDNPELFVQQWRDLVTVGALTENYCYFVLNRFEFVDANFERRSMQVFYIQLDLMPCRPDYLACSHEGCTLSSNRFDKFSDKAVTMATIGDVARAAGVARSTASYALSGKRSISKEVRQRVERAARELGYTPNAGARALATSQTRVIGLLAQFLPDEFAPAMLQYIQGVTNTARDAGYDILLCSDPDGPTALKRITESCMVDGVVLLNVAEHDDRLPILRSARQPGALVGLPADCSGIDVFDLDFEESGRMMVEHLYTLGHRELMLVSQPERVVERGGAYVWRLRDAAVETANHLGCVLHHVFGSSTQPGTGHALHALFDAHPRATGLLLNNEAAAVALPTVLRDRNLSAPHKVSVIGRYSDEFARTFSLSYSSIESAPDRLGQMAVRQLIRRIEGKENEHSPFAVRLIPPELIDRKSTAAAPPTNPLC